MTQFTPSACAKALTHFENQRLRLRSADFSRLCPRSRMRSILPALRGSPIFPSFFCHGRRHKNLAARPEKNTFRTVRDGPILAAFSRSVVPEVHRWTQDLVFDSDLTYYLLLTRTASPLSFGVFGGVEFQVPSGPSERLFSRRAQPAPEPWRLGQGLACARGKNPGSNRCQIRASGLDEVGWVETSTSNGGGPGQVRQKQKGGGQPSGNLGLETHAN